MGISLSKGQSISLSKDKGLTSVMMGLGWDAVQAKASGGFLSKVFGGGGSGEIEIDLDASVMVFDGAKNLLETIAFNRLTGTGIKHGGDNRTGAGDGDDEVIYVDLSAIDPRAQHLVFTVNSFSGQTFNEVENAVARLVDQSKGEEIARFELADQGSHTGVVMASLSKDGGGWKMTAHGKPCAGRMACDIATDAKGVL